MKHICSEVEGDDNIVSINMSFLKMKFSQKFWIFLGYTTVRYSGAVLVQYQTGASTGDNKIKKIRYSKSVDRVHTFLRTYVYSVQYKDIEIRLEHLSVLVDFKL